LTVSRASPFDGSSTLAVSFRIDFQTRTFPSIIDMQQAKLKIPSEFSSTARIRDLPRELAIDTMQYLESKKKIKRKPNGCWEAQTSKARDYAQVVIKTRAGGNRSRGRVSSKEYASVPAYKSKRMLVHQVSLLAYSGTRPSEGQDVSHLCHNEICCNPAHLIIEAHEINMNRQRCLGTVVLTMQCSTCDEPQIVIRQVCSHAPACLVRTFF
jgi:hypothetical protein